MYLAQQRIVHDAHLDLVARTSYLASIDTWVQTATFVLQLVVAGPAIRWLGPGLVLAVLPLARGIGLTVLGATSSLAALRIVQVIGTAATHGLTRPARELLFTVVSRDDKYRAKNAIDTIGYRFGDLASSWLNKGLVAIGGAALAIAPLPLAAVWLAFAAIVGVGFRRRVARHAAEAAAQELP
jgi:AAA family ATP:ADP antiporter